MGKKLRLIETGLPGHFFVEAPPKDFSILRASIDDLHRYGLPHRPDPKALPNAARAWTNVMRRVKRFVTPKLAPRNDIVHGSIRGLRHSTVNGRTFHGGTNWSALVVTDAPPYLQVWGSWTIPEVQVPPNPPSGINTFFSAAWVGLGGFGNSNLLQAGTEHDITAGANPTYSAWIEWFPAGSFNVDGFQVDAGQTIAVFVGQLGDGSGRGLVGMANLETGDAIPMQVVPIPTTDFNGNAINPPITAPSGASAEWVIERPALLVNGNFVNSELADFGELNFTYAGALIDTSGPKTETIAAASDTNAIGVQMIADDNVTVLSQEMTTASLQMTFEQTAVVQIQEEGS